MNSKLLRMLHAQWRKLSPGIEVRSQESGASIDDERQARLEWTNQHLRKMYGQRGGRFATIQGRKVFIPVNFKVINSWNSLTEGEARRLIRFMREESGDGPAYRARLIAQFAAELWGPQWDEFLAARLGERFRVSRAQDLAPRDARAMMEELKSRIARGAGVPPAGEHGRDARATNPNAPDEAGAGMGNNG